MKFLWIALVFVLIQPIIADAQNYRVEITKLMEVSGDVRRGSCGGGCCEGHDGTACAGVRVRNEWNVVVNTAVYDNVPCCEEQCHERQHCGLPIFGHSGPADICPRFYGRFSATVGDLDLCVTPGETFWVPQFTARVGNLVNNNWTSGSNCSGYDPFEPYNATDRNTSTQWGGFWDTCPNPESSDVICVPSDCGTTITIKPPGVAPVATAEIIEPYGNKFFPRWDRPEIHLRWRPVGVIRTDLYRVVAFDWRGKLFDEFVNCPHEECSYRAWFPVEPGAYYWWVQPMPPDSTGQQSRAGHFNLSRPLTSCTGLGGSCTGNPGPYGPIGCQGGGVPIDGAVDCPEVCCSGDCSRDESHDHTGSCGSYDICGHVFGSPSDPGCGPEPPANTKSCGELGGDYCSQTIGCPSGHYSLGTTRLDGIVECVRCCQETVGDGYCEPDVEDCGTSPDDCACRAPGAVCVTSGTHGECVDRCSDPTLHDHTGSCGEFDECGHSIGDPRDCLSSCGSMGGDHCSQDASCPSGFSRLGPSNDCITCCETIPCASTGCPAGSCGMQIDNCGDQIFCGECAPSCGEMGGDYCSQTGSCPAGYNSLGASNDCNPCCKTKPCTSTGCPAGSCGWKTDNCGNSIFCGQCAPTCGAMGGDYCSQGNSCPGGYSNLGQSSDCKRCCKSPPSCGAMGGNYCSQTGSCPSGYISLGKSNDCSPCCVSN